MNVADLISLITDIAIALIALGGLVVAGLGLSTWRRELRGREEFTLAREVLRCVYRVRDEISFVRKPGMFPSEWQDRPGRDESKPSCSDEDLEYAYQRRWDNLIEASSDLEAKSLEAEVLWGSALKEPQHSLKKLISRLNVGLSRHFRSRKNEPFAEGLGAEGIKKINALIWENYEDPDDFSSQVQAIVERFESELRPHLARKWRRSLFHGRFCNRTSGQG